MADPLSTAASIVTLLDLAAKALSYLREVKDSPKECKSLILELSLIRGVLQSLKESLHEQAGDDWYSTILSLSDESGPLRQLSQTVDDLRQRFEKQKHGGLDAITTALKWPFEKKAAEALLVRLERHKTLLTLALSNDNAALAREIFGNTKTILWQVGEIRQKMVQQEAKQTDKTTQELLEWLSTQDHEATQADILSTRQDSTCTWLFNTTEFQKWLQVPSRVLFCKGMPGAGKTVLTSVVVDHLREVEDSCTLQIYCGRHAATGSGRLDMTELLGGLIRQLLQAEDTPDLEAVKTIQTQPRHKNKSQELTSLLSQKVARQSRMFILIDALDECQEEVRENILSTLRQLKPRPSLFLTSRDITNDEAEFEDMEMLEIHASSEDISCYVDARIRSSNSLSKHLAKDRELRERIGDSITKTAKGMFLMAKLHVDLLEKGAKRAKWALLQAVSTLPDGLDSTYDAVLDRMDAQSTEDREFGHRVLTWVQRSPQPLSMQQLQFALLIQPGHYDIDEDMVDTPEYILLKSGGLVEADRNTATVRFVHSTVRDFLQRNPQRLEQPDNIITRTCLTYLNSHSFAQISPDLPKGELLDRLYSNYEDASEPDNPSFSEEVAMIHSRIYEFRRLRPFSAYVVDTLASLIREDRSKDTEEDIQMLFTSTANLYIYHDIRRWFSFYLHLGHPLPATRDPALLALELEIPHVACWLISRAVNRTMGNTPDSISQTLSPSEPSSFVIDSLESALHYATFRGQRASVNYLLSQGANISSPLKPLQINACGHITQDHTIASEGEQWYTPLCQAIARKDDDMVKLLLEHGAKLDLVRHNDHHLEIPLRLTVLQGNLTIVKLLIERGADTMMRYAQGNTIVHIAVQAQVASCLKLLLELNVPFDLPNDSGESALYLAVLSRQSEAVKILVQHGARPKALLDHSPEQVHKIDSFRSLLLHGSDEDLALLFQQFSQTSIKIHSGCVLGRFKELVATGLLERNQSEATTFEHINHQLTRFSMWASNIGAFAKGHASLDVRLKGKPQVLSTILTLLENMQEELDNGECCFWGSVIEATVAN
ncbi:hypothetical protein P154DRAFT_572544 [Amniculicola lignicola CBS 123094]|uniref:Uncharacterized protein n=1 Tax=Amniculicola lignicola CBS 123094 TaxID=1392246 RepID=A0A6A5WT10_9PLEO|nr:hypothetical protein P154DRAFT_572544 [Amniculicola lignicola CBS 123094]